MPLCNECRRHDGQMRSVLLKLRGSWPNLGDVDEGDPLRGFTQGGRTADQTCLTAGALDLEEVDVLVRQQRRVHPGRRLGGNIGDCEPTQRYSATNAAFTYWLVMSWHQVARF